MAGIAGQQGSQGFMVSADLREHCIHASQATDFVHPIWKQHRQRIHSDPQLAKSEVMPGDKMRPLLSQLMSPKFIYIFRYLNVCYDVTCYFSETYETSESWQLDVVDTFADKPGS